jgi:hypothetical protein
MSEQNYTLGDSELGGSETLAAPNPGWVGLGVVGIIAFILICSLLRDILRK